MIWDEQLAELQAKFPLWQIWYVPHAIDGGATWCANPWAKQDDRRHVLHADTPEHLAEHIADCAHGRFRNLK